MGGRGSSFNYLDNYNINDENTTSAKDYSNFDDPDTEKEYDGRTKTLKDKHIHIKQSTDTLNEDMFIPNIEKVNSLSNKYNITTKILEPNNNQVAIRSYKLTDGAVAQFSHHINNFKGMEITFNNNLKLKNRKIIENETQEQINTGFWSNSDNDELINHSVTHEFGHYVQKILLEAEKETKFGQKEYQKYFNEIKQTTDPKKRNLITSKYCEDHARRCYREIQRIHYKKFKKAMTFEDVQSRYATGERGSDREIFAELFANLHTTQKPTTASKALGIFLDKKLKQIERKKYLTKDNN